MNRQPVRRRPKNEPEGKFFDWAEQQGYDVCKRGWPDFFLEKDGQIMCVEVKPKASHPLKFDQERVLAALAAYGVPCFKWTPDGGLERIYSGSSRSDPASGV